MQLLPEGETETARNVEAPAEEDGVSVMAVVMVVVVVVVAVVVVDVAVVVVDLFDPKEPM